MSAPFTSAPAATEATSSALRRLIDAIDGFERAGASVPMHLDGQLQDGEWAALAQRVQRLAHRVSEQVEALDHATRQRRDLLANVSHDLRTPLAAMQGYLELLLLRHANLEPKERHNYLEIAARQSERLARLVSDLFQLAELDGDDARPEREDFALGELIQDVIQKHASDAARRKIDTRLLATGTAALVHADIALVERLLTGLMENALRHTPAGGSVTLQAAYEADPRARSGGSDRARHRRGHCQCRSGRPLRALSKHRAHRGLEHHAARRPGAGDRATHRAVARRRAAHQQQPGCGHRGEVRPPVGRAAEQAARRSVGFDHRTAFERVERRGRQR